MVDFIDTVHTDIIRLKYHRLHSYRSDVDLRGSTKEASGENIGRTIYLEGCDSYVGVAKGCLK